MRRVRKCSMIVFGVMCAAHPVYTQDKGAVSYQFNGGRFGDNLCSLSKAYWIASKNGLRFLFRPFAYSGRLVAHHVCDHYDEESVEKYEGQEVIREKFVLDERVALLYMSTFYCKAGINWKDEQFLADMRRLIAPYGDWDYLPLPNDKRTIAIHIRRGGGYRLDSNFCRHRRPLHFPSMSFYADTLKLLLQRFADEHFYVHIFSDDRDPARLVQALRDGLGKDYCQRVEFNWRCKGNVHNANVLEDFFDMMRFNCLIRPNSNLSVFAERLGGHEIVAHPKAGGRGKPWGNITQVELRICTCEGRTTERIPIGSAARKGDSQKSDCSDQQNLDPPEKSPPSRSKRKRARRSAGSRRPRRRRSR